MFLPVATCKATTSTSCAQWPREAVEGDQTNHVADPVLIGFLPRTGAGRVFFFWQWDCEGKRTGRRKTNGRHARQWQRCVPVASERARAAMDVGQRRISRRDGTPTPLGTPPPFPSAFTFLAWTLTCRHHRMIQMLVLTISGRSKNYQGPR